MQGLSFQHIDQIARDLGRQEITFSHLVDDLIDHVCCDVEDEMHNGLSFQEAYNKVKLKMGSWRRIREIQEETLFAVDTKYRQMKNTMKIAGITGTILLGFAALFKIMHWPGAGVMMTLGVLILAFVFMPSALSVLWKETHNKGKLFLFISSFFAAMFFLLGVLFKVQHWPLAGFILFLAGIAGVFFFIPSLLWSRYSDPESKAKRPAYVVGAAGMIFCLAGMLFKIQHWPLASTLTVAGLITLFMIALPWYTWLTWKEEPRVNIRFIFLLIGSLAILIPAAMVSLNLQRSYDRGYYLNNKQEQAVYNYLYSRNSALLDQYRDSSAFRTMEQLHSKTNELINLLSSVGMKMVAESEGRRGTPPLDPDYVIQTGTGPAIRYEYLSSPFNVWPVKHFLATGTASRTEIENAISGYKNFLSETVPAGVFENLGRVLDPTIYFPPDVSEGKDISLISGLHSLLLLQNGILAAEGCSLESIPDKL